MPLPPPGRPELPSYVERLTRRYLTDHATASQIAHGAATSLNTILRQLRHPGITCCHCNVGHDPAPIEPKRPFGRLPKRGFNGASTFRRGTR